MAIVMDRKTSQAMKKIAHQMNPNAATIIATTCYLLDH
jgi:hypothetical protein